MSVHKAIDFIVTFLYLYVVLYRCHSCPLLLNFFKKNY